MFLFVKISSYTSLEVLGHLVICVSFVSILVICLGLLISVLYSCELERHHVEFPNSGERGRGAREARADSNVW